LFDRVCLLVGKIFGAVGLGRDSRSCACSHPICPSIGFTTVLEHLQLVRATVVGGGGLGRRPLLVNGNHSNSQRAALLLGMSCLVLCLAAALWTDAPEAPRLVVTLLCSITRALIFTRVAQVWDVRDHPLVVPPLANSQLFSRSPSCKSCQQSTFPPCTRYTNKKDASRCTWSEGTTGFGCLGRGAGGGATGATSSTLYARRLDRE
jgi:hypothetical protein